MRKGQGLKNNIFESLRIVVIEISFNLMGDVQYYPHTTFPLSCSICALKSVKPD